VTQPPEPPPWGPPPPPQQPQYPPPSYSPPPQQPYPPQQPQQGWAQQPYPQQPQPFPPYGGGQPPRGGGRARLWVALSVGLVVVLVAVLVPVLLLAGGDDDEPGARDDTSQSPDDGTDDGAPEPPATDLSEVQEFADLPTTHVTEPVDYEQVPPAGGEHYAEWLDCGVYDEPVPDENAVHDLEHGTVWITHDPDLPADDLAALAEQLPQNGIMSPYDGLPSPVVVTVWERQLALTGADDPRLELFVQEFQDGVTAPEPFASCAGGTADPDGGAGVPA
jgi:hypothetical protein